MTEFLHDSISPLGPNPEVQAWEYHVKSSFKRPSFLTLTDPNFFNPPYYHMPTASEIKQRLEAQRIA